MAHAVDVPPPSLAGRDKGDAIQRKVSGSTPTIFFVRHGDTPLNSDAGGTATPKLRGWQNVPLTDNGRAEVRLTASKLAKENVSKIISSDLQPAMDTASIISDKLGVPITKDKNLRTWDVGSLTGQPVDKARKIQEKYQNDTPDKPLPAGSGFQGESFNSYLARWGGKGVPRLQKEAENSDGAIVAVTHGHNLRSLARVLSGDESTPVPMEGVAGHGDILKVEKFGGNWKVAGHEEIDKGEGV
jgi:glucosyl-3-phosphoglycerate phosphatase